MSRTVLIFSNDKNEHERICYYLITSGYQVVIAENKRKFSNVTQSVSLCAIIASTSMFSLYKDNPTILMRGLKRCQVPLLLLEDDPDIDANHELFTYPQIISLEKNTHIKDLLSTLKAAFKQQSEAGHNTAY